ncbi:MAG TPA: hypothetical protein VMH78_04140 [Thermoplasmata archaeon]|nr:hypothetical protein [Thermoplasmata archaeon]
MPRPPRLPADLGLKGLRRAGAVSEILFLFECATEATPKLQPIAARLGLTVQAVSHTYRQLRRNGLAEHRNGLYRPTVRGVAWLHAALSALRDDLSDRWGRLDVVRTCRAVAGSRLSKDASVALALEGGTLVARRGTGPSRGRTLEAARSGELVEVGHLEGIVPVAPGPVAVWTFPDPASRAPATVAAIAGVVGDAPEGLLAAFGLEAAVLLGRATRRPFVRFGVAAAAAEASALGVPATIVVRAPDLPRLLGGFDRVHPPPVTTRPLAGPTD